MFYLLEDNRIIIDNKKHSHIFCYEDRKGFLYKTFEDKNYGKTKKLGKIKKQSEHVYYLINWENDLVRTKDGDVINCSQLFLFYMQEYVDKQLFTAIYKPNSNGDYIKVWEKKEE